MIFSRFNIRRTLLWVHRWVGVLAGLVILVIATTGGALVFEPTIQRWLRPDLYPSETVPRSQRVLLSVAIEKLNTAFPGARVMGMRLPQHERDSLVLFTAQKAMHVHPRTGDVLGSRPRRGGWEQTMLNLHVNLLQGSIGGTVVVIATMLTLGLSLSGLWLWWPLRIVWFSKNKGKRRFYLDLHSVAGLYSSVFLLIISISGLTLHYLHGDHPSPPQAMRPTEPNGSRISIDEATRIAEATLKGSYALAVEMPPPNPRVPFRVQTAYPEDGSPAGRSVVFISQLSGEVLAVHSSRVGNWLEIYQMAQLSIHTGTIGGTLTRSIAFLVCISLLLQVISGYILWWKRPGTKKATVKSENLIESLNQGSSTAGAGS
ncbi:MAG: PepSY-associated TM helix domain-containing protein [Pirellulaceae bacterium]|nr:PepSY-associated TM helix domain-containing protein [Pirellulaceae bacterium]